MNSMARRMFELLEPIGAIPYTADEPNEAMFALGLTSYWDTYFAGRAAPLGLVAAEVVDALFYNFAPGEVARHIPKVWRTTTPEAANAARQTGCVKALRRILGDHALPGRSVPGIERCLQLHGHRAQRIQGDHARLRRGGSAIGRGRMRAYPGLCGKPGAVQSLSSGHRPADPDLR